jgi:hypothetical protein
MSAHAEALGQRDTSARQHVRRQVAARAVVAAADEREQALAGPAGDVEHVCGAR